MMKRTAIVSTLGLNSIKVEVKIYIDGILNQTVVRSYLKNDIVEIEFIDIDNYISIMMRDSHGTQNWLLTTDQSNTNEDRVIIETLNGVQILTNLDLFEKVTLLRD